MVNIWLLLMVIIWLMMVNHNLVGGIPNPLKNMSASVGMIVPNIWKNKRMFQTTNQDYDGLSILVTLGISIISGWKPRKMICELWIVHNILQSVYGLSHYNPMYVNLQNIDRQYVC